MGGVFEVGWYPNVHYGEATRGNLQLTVQHLCDLQDYLLHQCSPGDDDGNDDELFLLYGWPTKGV